MQIPLPAGVAKGELYFQGAGPGSFGEKVVCDFAEGVLRLLDAPRERAAIGARGRRHVLNRFDVERLTDDVERFYQELLSANP